MKQDYVIKRIELEGMPNTRDLGGMPTKDGRHIRPKRLLRSGDLCNATEADARFLRETCQISKVIDLRTAEERAQRPDRQIEGVSYVQLPILEEKTLGITREQESDRNVIDRVICGMLGKSVSAADAAERYMQRMYANFLQSAFARGQYRRFFEELLNAEGGSVLWHCTAGKDRAGLAAVLLLSALGVEEELIMADYLKTNEFARPVAEQQGRLAAERTGKKEAGIVIEKLFSVEPSYLEAVYAEIAKAFGTMDAFLEQEMGLDDKNRQRLRALYLEP